MADKLEELSGLELGQKVNSKEVSPVEVIDYFENYITQTNPKLNAFVYTKFGEARNEAVELSEKLVKNEYIGPFAGVPTALKDFLPTKAGWTASHGGVECMHSLDTEDSMFYKAVKKLGAIAVGKTNAPAFGFRGTTDNQMYGPTCTPYKEGYNSGGSSGGSGSAVGSGMVPFAEGGDAGGSIRIPAAWCNCFGFKPSAGVVPSICRPDAWTATHPYCCGGPITRTVKDAAIIFDAMRGYDPHDPISVPIKMPNAASVLDDSIRDLKIGFTLDFNLFPIPESPIVNAITETVDRLRSCGCEVKHSMFKFHFPLADIEKMWLQGISIDDAVNPYVHEMVEKYPEQFPAEFLKWNTIARNSNMCDYLKFHMVRTDILDAHLNVFDDCDIILAPTTGCMPVKNADDRNTVGPETISGVPINPLIGFGYTYLENMIGTPAASIPVGFDKEGLPIGLQVIGRRYEDYNVFKVCSAIEKMI